MKTKQQKLWLLVRDKTKFVESLALMLGKNPGGIRANWFTMGKIPKSQEAIVTKELKKQLRTEVKQVQKELKS